MSSETDRARKAAPPGSLSPPTTPALRVVRALEDIKMKDMDTHILECYREPQRHDEGFQRLCEKYLEPVQRMTNRRLIPYRSWSTLWDLREDLAHNTIERLNRRLRKPGEPDKVLNLEAVVHDAAVSVVLTAIRSKCREEKIFPRSVGILNSEGDDEGGGMKVQGTVPPEDDEAIDFAAESPLMRALRECRAQLREKAQIILERWCLETPLEDTARSLGMAYNSVNVSRIRSVEALAKCLQNKGFITRGAGKNGGRS